MARHEARCASPRGLWPQAESNGVKNYGAQLAVVTRILTIGCTGAGNKRYLSRSMPKGATIIM